MPPLIAAALIGAGLYAGYRVAGFAFEALAKLGETGQRPAAPEGDEAAKLAVKDLGALERDPKTGVYRPVRRE